jgi:hypothetical protein
LESCSYVKRKPEYAQIVLAAFRGAVTVRLMLDAELPMLATIAEPFDRVADREEDDDERGVVGGRFRAVARSRSDHAHDDNGRYVPTPSRLSLKKGIEAVGNSVLRHQG